MMTLDQQAEFLMQAIDFLNERFDEMDPELDRLFRNVIARAIFAFEDLYENIFEEEYHQVNATNVRVFLELEFLPTEIEALLTACPRFEELLG